MNICRGEGGESTGERLFLVGGMSKYTASGGGLIQPPPIPPLGKTLQIQHTTTIVRGIKQKNKCKKHWQGIS